LAPVLGFGRLMSRRSFTTVGGLTRGRRHLRRRGDPRCALPSCARAGADQRDRPARPTHVRGGVWAGAPGDQGSAGQYHVSILRASSDVRKPAGPTAVAAIAQKVSAQTSDLSARTVPLQTERRVHLSAVDCVGPQVGESWLSRGKAQLGKCVAGVLQIPSGRLPRRVSPRQGPSGDHLDAGFLLVV
jgi:hypothetical protein